MAIMEKTTRIIMVRMGMTNTAETIDHPCGRMTTVMRWAAVVRPIAIQTVGDTDHLGGRRPTTVRLAAKKTVNKAVKVRNIATVGSG